MKTFQRFAVGLSGLFCLVCLVAGAGSFWLPSNAANPEVSHGPDVAPAEGTAVSSARVYKDKFPSAGIDVFKATSDVSVDVLSVGETVKVHLEGQIVVERRDPVRNSNGPREIEMEVSSLELSGPMLGEKEIITIRGGKKFGLPVQGVIRSIQKDRDFPAISAFPMQFEILVPAVFGAKASRVLRHAPEVRFMEVSSIRSVPPFGEIFVNVNSEPLAFYDIDDKERKAPVILLQAGVVHDVLALSEEMKR